MKVKNIGIVQPIYNSPEDIREDYTLTNRPKSGQHAAKVRDWRVGLPELRTPLNAMEPIFLCFFPVCLKTITAGSKEVPCRMLVLCHSEP